MRAEAMYFEKTKDSKVHCYLCPHECAIKPGGLGACNARKNIGGKLCTLNYGKVTALSLDPIEKKPLKRFKPGSMILSVGSFGCNLRCPFCQNWRIAHGDPEHVNISPDALVDKALEAKSYENIGIAYTYNEPLIWYEYVLEASIIANRHGLYNVLVTNGFINLEPLKKVLPFIDAMNIDVKGFTESFYKDVCKAELDSIKHAVEAAAGECHVEITMLVIPGLNDSLEDVGRLAEWLASLNSEIPLHLSRFFPNYKMKDRSPTPVSILVKARERAMEHLKYVYIGNV